MPAQNNVEDERRLAGRLAGVLFLTAGVSALVIPLLPGADAVHGGWLIALAAVCVAWALYCLLIPEPEAQGAWFWHTPAVGALFIVAGFVASTGGADSPARFYLFFVLVYVACFYDRHEALPYVLGCIVVALLPLLYDGAAVEGGYVGELVVLCPAYLILGLLIIQGKELHVALRDRAEALALLDPLTELPNRRALLDGLRTATSAGSPTGLLLVDLDGFKDVNTAHGYPAGDHVLRETAARLTRALGADDVVSRLGGDEFAVLVPHATAESMAGLAERTLTALRDLKYDEIRLTASVGWAIHPTHAPSVDELIAAADFCLRGAKMTGKNRALSALDWAPEPPEPAHDGELAA